MVEYKYNEEIEMFRRVDNRGPSLKVNIVEARRIKSMMDLGIKAPTIMKKIDFVNNISMTNLRTIMSNIQNGNIDLDGDYPIPSGQIKDMDIEIRINQLEKDLNEFKRKVLHHDDVLSEMNDSKKKLTGRVKKWLQK